jgi:hypothetical protein
MSPNAFGASEDGIRERWLFRTWAGIDFGETNLTSGAAAILMGAAFRRAEQVRICFELASLPSPPSIAELQSPSACYDRRNRSCLNSLIFLA